MMQFVLLLVSLTQAAPPAPIEVSGRQAIRLSQIGQPGTCNLEPATRNANFELKHYFF